MQVDKWMTRYVVSVRPLDSIQHAREVMEAQRINQIPVVIEGNLVGIVTDRDLRDAFPSVFTAHQAHPGRGSDPAHVTVETVMTPHVLTIPPGTSMLDAARLMRKERIGALPVVEGEKLVGILTRSDVLDAFMAVLESTAVQET
jgi:acetoin utilization protein AcuB